MTMSDRGIHPDLIDDEPEPPARESPSPHRGRAARAAPQPEPVTPTAEVAESPEPPTPVEQEAAPAASAEEPDWWKQAKEAADPKAALALLAKHLPKTDLEQDPTLQGWIGDMGARRARTMLERSEQEKIEQQKHEALANGDFYGLGQLTAPELRARAEQLSASQQGAPFMDGVTHFQSQLPTEIQAVVQGKTFGAGKSYAEGVSEYLAALTEAAVSHRLNEAVERELKRREPVLRKAWLSESNGNQPVPELEGGRATSVREITDVQVGNMSLAEYDAHFDANGQPKPGVRVRLTRGIDTRRQR
jgi:hypothetical protein